MDHCAGSRAMVILLFWAFTTIVFGHETGQLTGRVFDTADSVGLAGVNIVVKGTIFGTSTAPDGSFHIDDLPVAEYKLIITYIGYESSERNIIINPEETLDIQVYLQPGAIDLSEIMVEAERPFSAASSRSVRQLDLWLRPVRSSQEILQLAPGLVIAQHGGGGKAEQIFLRGFDADHGTDVAISADGIPVNMISHGHGQGYADLHFLIPEIISTMDVYKGPYFARFGNLGTAGSVTFQTKDYVNKNLIKLEGGKFNTQKLTTVFQIPSAGRRQNAYFAGQFYKTDGPFDLPQKFKRFNLFGKFYMYLSDRSSLAFSLGAFSSNWDQSGQIPDRAVTSGQITRWGAIDSLEGGITSRQNFMIKYTAGTGTDTDFMLQGYASRYNFKLFSNFTFFLNDPVYGDMFEQTDARNLAGLNAKYKIRKVLDSVLSTTTAGGGFRSDNINVNLWQSPKKIRTTLNVDSEVFERNFFLWAEQDFIFSPRWRLQLGLRADYFSFNVNDKLDTLQNPPGNLLHASGYAEGSMLNPKVNLVYSPISNLDIFTNFGTGFHSNDARSVVLAARARELITSGNGSKSDIEAAKVKTLPRAIGGEFGLRTHLGRNIILGLAGWYLNLEEELVYVGDEGTTEINGETDRLGLDAEVRLQLTSWLWADFDFNLSDGRFANESEGADNIPLAPRTTSTGGLAVLHPSGIEGSLRYRHIGDRPANEDNSVVARGYTVLDLGLAYRIRGMRIFAHMQNFLNSAWNEAQFDTESRLRYEPDAVSEIHFTPGNPINIQLGMSYEF